MLEVWTEAKSGKMGTLVTISFFSDLALLMNLRLKTLLASSIATVVLVTGLSVGLSYLILRQVALAETHTMSRRLDQTLKSLVDDLGVSINADNPPPNNGKHPPELMRPNIDISFVLDQDGNILQYSSQARAAGSVQLPPPSLQAAFTKLPIQWVSLPTTDPLDLPNGLQVGLLQTSEGLLLLTQRPLNQSNYEPLRLVTGQWLHLNRLQKLGDRTLLMLHLLSVNNPEVPVQLKHHPDNLRVIEEYTLKPDSGLLPLTNESINPPPAEMGSLNRPSEAAPAKNKFPRETKFQAGYVLLRDVKGEPIAILQAISPRPFTTQGEEGVKVLLVFLWVTILIFGIALNLLLDRWVLARLNNLGRQVKQVKADSSHSTQVSLPGQDELSQLATDINGMLQQQEHYQESLRLAKAEIEVANRELERLASIDGLTQVMNRRFFQIHLEELWQQALQTSQSLSLILCDVDFFKLYNDTYGHLAGDLCLQKVAKAMSAILEHEPAAIIARYGGEEFAVILADSLVSQSIELAEQMRSSVLQLKIPHSGSKAADWVTLSIGICTLVPQAHLSSRDLVAVADKHLYQAKAEGRNCVVTTRSAINYPQTEVRKQAEAS